MPSPMRKISYDRFGGPEVLALREVPVPAPGKGEILVRVHAAGINPIDWKMHTGALKILSGWQLPQGLGMEFAGGIFVTSLPVLSQIMGWLWNNFWSKFCNRLLGRLPNTKSLSALTAQVTLQGLQVVMGGSFGLADFRDVYAQTLARKFSGKTVITMAPRCPPVLKKATA